MNRLAGKVAVVTGASTGIGAGIARAFAAEGASVVVNYRSSRSEADAVVAAIAEAGGRAVAAHADVSKMADARSLVAAAMGEFGRLDVLVNNSGVFSFATFEEVTEEAFHQHFDTNVLGVLLMTQAASPHLAEGGSVINIGSSITRELPAGSSVYAATKGAVNALTGSLARELGPRGIRVNSINPGPVQTERTRAKGLTDSEIERAFVARTPLGRIGLPEDIAKVAVFLASEDAAWITGELIHASGGL